MLSIEMLGYLRLSERVKGKKAPGLLAYMAWAARQVPRSIIATLFWPYQSTEQSLHSLRNALWLMRKELGDIFVGDFFNVSLRDCDYCCDLHELKRLLAIGDRQSLEAAVGLYRGPMLDGFDIVSEPWRDWVKSEAETIRLDIGQAMTKLAEMQSSAGDHDLALCTARRLSSLDSYDESAVRLVMRKLVVGGRKPEAIAYFRKVADHLKSDLGCLPDAETAELFEEITRKPYRKLASFQPQASPQQNDDAVAARARMTASASASRIETIRAELSLALTNHAKLSRRAVRDMVIELGKIAEDLRLLERAPGSSVPLLWSAHRHAIA